MCSQLQLFCGTGALGSIAAGGSASLLRISRQAVKLHLAAQRSADHAALPCPALAPLADTEWKGWVLTAFFFIDAWLLGIALQRMAFGCLRVGIRARAALTTMIARKCYGMAHLTKETVSGLRRDHKPGLMMFRMHTSMSGVAFLLAQRVPTRPQAAEPLRPAPASRHLQAAEAVGFVANDINKVFEGIQEIHYLW